jgi:biotin-(acetyl-CoA carboxylase) ligase
MLGQEVSIEAVDKEVTGKVLDIGKDGALILMRPDRRVERIIGGNCRLNK